MKLQSLAWTLTSALCISLGLMAPAFAGFSLSVNGDVATYVGNIRKGDDISFVQQLNAAHSPPIRVLWLRSGGGSVGAGIAMARAIRRAGLATAVDARNALCGSSCTMMFVAGVRRYYVHGESVSEGFNAMTGLGFHLAHDRGKAYKPDTLSTGYSDQMCALYKEMGVPRACDLAARATFGPEFHPSGATALSLGIATSLSAP